MKTHTTSRPHINLMGISVRTNNDLVLNGVPENKEISATLAKYFSEAIHATIPNRKNPGTMYCVYTQFESDYRGNYTYFVGEEVDAIDDVPDHLESLVIPSQNYEVFTNAPGPMPAVVLNMWGEIWGKGDDFESSRNYIADFEVYDARALSPLSAVLDIYIGKKQ